MEMRKLKILIAEDELLIANWLRMELELMDYEVCGLVASGEEAIEAAFESDPDIILMDVSLNGKLSGTEAARRILEKTNIKITFMTGYSKVNVQKEIAGIEPEVILIKPIDPAEVKEVIDSF